MEWTAIGSHAGKILVAGHNKTKKRLEYLLVDAATFISSDRLTVTEKVEDSCESAVNSRIDIDNHMHSRFTVICSLSHQTDEYRRQTGCRLLQDIALYRHLGSDWR